MKRPTLLTELKLNLRNVIRCLQDVCRELKICYVYSPKDIPTEKFNASKSHLYRELNNSLILYREQDHNMIRSILVESIANHIEFCKQIPYSVQAIIELKSQKTKYRYAIAYINTSFTLVTPSTILRDIADFQDVVKVLTDDISNNVHCYSSIEQMKFTMNLNNDKVNVKYVCTFSYNIVNTVILNAIMLLFYINRYLTVCKPQV